MTVYKLIGSTTSPFVRKVRVVLAEKRIDYELILEDVMADAAKIQAINPLGKIPVLLLDDAPPVFDSRVIAEYLDASSPVHRLIPPNGRERIDVKRWEALADGMTDAAVLLRYEQVLRPVEQQSALWIARQQGKVRATLAEMNRQLGAKPWCSGGQFSLADVAVGCALSYLDFRFAEVFAWRDEFPNLARLDTQLAGRPSFKDSAPHD